MILTVLYTLLLLKMYNMFEKSNRVVLFGARIDSQDTISQSSKKNTSGFTSI